MGHMKHLTMELTLSEEEVSLLQTVTKELRMKPEKLTNQLLHDFLERARDCENDSIWDFIGSGSSWRNDWSKKHTRRMVSEE